MIVFDAVRRRPGVTRAVMAGRRLVVVVSVALASCGPQGSERAEGARSDTVMQAQRDSAVARSGLPGARGVTRAQDVSSAAEQRAAQLDSIR